MNTLFVIPARGGSKGIPRKNIKMFGGKPLIHYSIEIARSLAEDINICVSTDDPEIKEVAEQTGIKVPFLRPKELATDQSGTYEVLLHALDYYTSKGITYDLVVLLQPTSPFRQVWHVKEAIDSWEESVDMIVSVKITKSNPYYLLAEENEDGFLIKSKKADFVRRQDCPTVYEYNGAVYVIKIDSLRERSISDFQRVKKYVMDDLSSLDVDTLLDWRFAEFLLETIKNDIKFSA